MVKITNGVNVFEVTRGAFDGIYSRQGYTIVNDGASNRDVTPVEDKKNEDELFVSEIVEKPVSMWSKDEVKRFAAMKDIDISGTKTVTEARNIIKAFLSVEEDGGDEPEE